ncbi:piggyBac transposable element-derived protein 4-like [Tachysurus fulvidraco]|uniref:piggyBac transposable element-derived protein 4-like n=1 Tax=Tachysurus fulvidraco TaxID=1234273 RepID=UPI001FEDA767|nr:piggyBac transposable element-derived protein 4-like [Tachysurus fulvidraco]
MSSVRNASSQVPDVSSQLCADVKTETNWMELHMKQEETTESNVYHHGDDFDHKPDVISIKVEEADGESYLYCEFCKSRFFTKCEVHGPALFIADTPVPMGVNDRARQTLPTGLEIRNSGIPDAGLGVFNKGEIVPVGAHFGPYQGELVDREDTMNSRYSWVISRSAQGEKYIDAKREMHANWMRYVNCARNEGEQNLMAFRYQGEILYRCCRAIAPGQELLVWYEEGYAKDLGRTFDCLWNVKHSANGKKFFAAKEATKVTGEISDDDNSSSSESDLSVDSEAEEDFLKGRDPDLELEPESSDSDYQPETKRPRRTPVFVEEELEPQSSTSTQPAGQGRGRPRGRTRGRAGLRSTDKQTSVPEGSWQGTDVEDITPDQPSFHPARTPGGQLKGCVKYTILQLFSLFMTDDLLQVIVNNSNKFGESKHPDTFQKVTLAEMKSYLAMIIYMGLVKTPGIRDYWRKSELYAFSFPSSVISGRRFKAISRVLHLSDPGEDAANNSKRGTAGYDRLCKIKPLYHKFRKMCMEHYHPHQCIAIDERIVASKARSGFRQYMKNKPVKWGYKLFVLVDSTNGYTWDFFIYEGKGAKIIKGLSYDSIMRLTNTHVLGTGYKLFVDNFYTSPNLFRDLLEKKIWACGTIRGQRIGFPKDRQGGLVRSSARGTIRWIREGPMVFVQWRDTKDVLMCSTFHAAHGEDSVRRRIKGADGQWSVQDVPIPPAMKDYNRNMGGVDLSEAMIDYYSVLHKTKKWYRSVLYQFVDIAIVNAFILYKEMANARNEKVMSHKDFRETLVMELRAVGSTTTAPPKPPPPAPKGASHKPVRFSQDSNVGRRRCVHCHQRTTVKCTSCDVSLCFTINRDCYNAWHTLKKL